MGLAYGDLLNVASDGGRRVDGFLRQAVGEGAKKFKHEAALKDFLNFWGPLTTGRGPSSSPRCPDPQ